jgi:hypothetical protein
MKMINNRFGGNSMDPLYFEYLAQKKGILQGVKEAWEENKDNPDFKMKPEIINWLIREMGTGLEEYEKLYHEYNTFKKEKGIEN